MHKDDWFCLWEVVFKHYSVGAQFCEKPHAQVSLFPNIFRWWVNIGRPGCTQGGMLVSYLFGSYPKIYGTPALVHDEGVLCISCTVAGSYTIKWVALSVILT